MWVPKSSLNIVQFHNTTRAISSSGKNVKKQQQHHPILLPHDFVLGNKEAGYRTEGQGGVGAGPCTIIDQK